MRLFATVLSLGLLGLAAAFQPSSSGALMMAGAYTLYARVYMDVYVCVYMWRDMM